MSKNDVIYCIKDYTEFKGIKISFKKDKSYTIIKDGYIISIIDTENNTSLRFNKWSPFAENKFIECFATLKEYRKMKLKNLIK